ncbi:MAG: ATP-binding cassette domain-containing protein [Caldilineaceae bacterium]
MSLALYPGEILRCWARMAAGKSTLMNIIYGLYQPSEGEIFVKGRAVSMNSPR